MTSRKIHLSFLIESVFDEKVLTVFRGKTKEGFLKRVARYCIVNTSDGLDFKGMSMDFDVFSVGLDIRELAVLTHYLGKTPEYLNSYWSHTSRALLHVEVERGPAFKFNDKLSWHDFREVEKLALNMSRGKKPKDERFKVGSAYVKIK